MKNTPSKTLNEKQIIEVITKAAESSYGVMGINKRLNKKGKEENDIIISNELDGKISITIHVLVAPNIKITEIVRSCQKTIKNRFEALSPKTVKAVNIVVEDIL